MLGFGIGGIGLGLDDFCRLTFTEFRAVCKNYQESEEQRHRSEWERARMLSFHFLQPFMNRKCSPKELMPLPWDHDREEETDAVSRDEARRRMERRIRKEVQ